MSYRRSNSPNSEENRRGIDPNENAELTRLIKKAMRGNERAFEHLYKRYIKEIVYYSRNLLAVPEDAEDAAQEIILALQRNIQKLQSPYAFKSYLIKITYTVCATRNRGYHVPSEQIDEYEDRLEDTSMLGPQGSFEQMELSEAVGKVIAALPPKQRETLVLRYLDDLDYEEIAQLLNVSINTVGSNILRAKRTLKHLIESDSTIIAEGQAKEMPRLDDRTDDTNTLRGEAFSPILSVAVAQMVEEQVSAESVKAVIEAVGPALKASSGTASSGHNAMKMLGKILAATVAIAVILGGVFIALQLLSPGEPDEGLSIDAPQTEYDPDARIEFLGNAPLDTETSAASEHINPTEARLVLSEGAAFQWTITDTSDAELLQGSGPVVAGVFAGLEPGIYTLTWIAGDESGNRVYVKRDFLIT